MPTPLPYDTNALVNQTKAMLAQTAAQGATQFKGSSFDTGTPITPQSLTPQTPMPVTQPPAPTSAPDTSVGSSMIDTNNASLGTSGTSDTTQQPDWLKTYLQTATPPPSVADQYATDYASSGIAGLQSDVNAKTAAVNAARSKLNAINAQLSGLNAEKTAIPIQIQQNAQEGGANVTKGGLAPIQTAQLRNNALQAIPLQSAALVAQAELAGAQGDQQLSQSILSQAQDHLDKVFQIHAQDAQNLYNYNKGLRDMIYQDATAKEKAQLDAQNKASDRAFTIKQDAINNAQQAARDAIANGQGDIAAKIGQLNPDSKTYAADVAALQGQIVNKSAQLDIQMKQAQLQKLQSDIRVANATESTVSPDTLQGMINVYKATGVVPAMGLSAKSPLRAQFYAALGADGGLVTDATTNKSIRAGLNKAYGTQQNQYSANQTAIKTLDGQLALAQQYSDQVNRSDSPLVNKYLLSLRTGVFGDPQTAALNNIVTTAAYEFSKILAGSAASVAGATVSSSQDAKNLLNSAMAKGQFNEVLGLMHTEANLRLNSQKDTLDQLQKDLNNVGSLSTDLKQASTESTQPKLLQPSEIPSGYYQASDGLLYKR